jgi:hypothetical protein
VGIAYVLTLMMLFRITIQLVVGVYSEIAMVTKIRKQTHSILFIDSYGNQNKKVESKYFFYLVSPCEYLATRSRIFVEILRAVISLFSSTVDSHC